jgi:hypothetical protein
MFPPLTVIISANVTAVATTTMRMTTAAVAAVAVMRSL